MLTRFEWVDLCLNTFPADQYSLEHLQACADNYRRSMVAISSTRRHRWRSLAASIDNVAKIWVPLLFIIMLTIVSQLELLDPYDSSSDDRLAVEGEHAGATFTLDRLTFSGIWGAKVHKWEILVVSVVLPLTGICFSGMLISLVKRVVRLYVEKRQQPAVNVVIKEHQANIVRRATLPASGFAEAMNVTQGSEASIPPSTTGKRVASINPMLGSSSSAADAGRTTNRDADTEVDTQRHAQLTSQRHWLDQKTIREPTLRHAPSAAALPLPSRTGQVSGVVDARRGPRRALQRDG